ncbi:MAG: putative lipid II flippase FtsW [Candidatus Omnitrophica bacterium]|nr:putative lipid II flippase FtsW [Candidatus Omnitrophota bacterium]
MSREMRFFFVTVFFLIGLGVVMTYSASAIYAEYLYNNSVHFLVRQVMYAFFGIVLMLATANIPVSFWKTNARVMMLTAIFLLILAFAPLIGHAAGGARRWINLGFFNFQPAEFAKLAICIYLADYLSRKKKIIQKGSLKVFLPALFLVGCVCALILMQPDLGSCIFIFLIVGVLIFLVGIRLKYLWVASLVVIPIFYFLVMRVPYRLNRVLAFLNPWEDPQGTGFQIIQSFMAFSLGGVRGVGLGESMQKLFYLPSSYNDFIFSIIGEELGLIGVFVVMAAYIVIFVCGIRMAQRSAQDFERLLVLAITFLIVLQAIIHMLVTTGLIPTKGLPLPFVSLGGTSLVMNLVAVGLLLGIDRQHRRR